MGPFIFSNDTYDQLEVTDILPPSRGRRGTGGAIATTATEAAGVLPQGGQLPRAAASSWTTFEARPFLQPSDPARSDDEEAAEDGDEVVSAHPREADGATLSFPPPPSRTAAVASEETTPIRAPQQQKNELTTPRTPASLLRYRFDSPETSTTSPSPRAAAATAVEDEEERQVPNGGPPPPLAAPSASNYRRKKSRSSSSSSSSSSSKSEGRSSTVAAAGDGAALRVVASRGSVVGAPPTGEHYDAEGSDGGDGVSYTVDALPATLSPDELQLERLQRYDGSSLTGQPPLEGGGDICVIDFLWETGQVVLPDVVASFFVKTTALVKRGGSAVAASVPPPLRQAVAAAGSGVAAAAEAVGELLANIPSNAMRVVPDAVLSPHWKQYLVDAVPVLRCSFNSNLLVTPYLLHLCGLGPGIALIVVMSVIGWYNTEVYMDAKRQLKLSSHVILYGDVPRLTFGWWSPAITAWCSLLHLAAVMAYAAVTTQALLPHLGIHGAAATALSFTAPPLLSLPLVLMKRARSQPPLVTLVGLLLTAGVVLVLVALPFGDAAVNGAGGSPLRLVPRSAADVAVALGLAVYGTAPLRMAVPVERAMAPARFRRLLRLTVPVAAVVQLGFGLAVVFVYGAATCGVLPLTLDRRPRSRPVAVAVLALSFVGHLGYIPLVLFDVAELADRRVLGWRVVPAYGATGPNFLRIFLLCLCSLVAFAVPFFALLLALAGVTGYCLVLLLIPTALDWVRRERRRLRQGQSITCIDYVFVGGGFCIGSAVLIGGSVLVLYQAWLLLQVESDASIC